MKSNKLATEVLLDELLSVFYQKFIFYVPSEIITEGVIEQLKDDIDRSIFNEFCFMDIYNGISNFYNEDAVELNTLLTDKISFLEQNTFKLVANSKEMTAFEFQMVIEKYDEFLRLFIYMSDWLNVNLKKYNQADIHISIVGAYNLQFNFFANHLKEIRNYFSAILNLEIKYDFSKHSFVTKYLPEVIARFSKITDQLERFSAEIKNDKNVDSISNQEVLLENNESEKTVIKKKKQRPQLDQEYIENMILTQVFNIEEEYEPLKKSKKKNS